MKTQDWGHNWIHRSQEDGDDGMWKHFGPEHAEYPHCLLLQFNSGGRLVAEQIKIIGNPSPERIQNSFADSDLSYLNYSNLNYVTLNYSEAELFEFNYHM